MVVNAYALLDTKTGLYSQPWFFVHDAGVFRSVVGLSEDPNTTVAKYPDDFVLYRIGVFDDNSGNLASIAPVNLGAVSAIVAALKGGNH